jgi:hypothetical protein
MPTFNTSDFSALTAYLTEIFNESAKRKVADWKGKTLFNTSTPERQVYTYQMLDGVSQFGRVAEGGQFPKATLTQGDSATWTQKRYGGRVSITKDMRKFDLYNEMNRLVRSNADAAFDTIDQSQADLILNGFTSTSYTDVYGDSQSNVAPDGVVLFSASHSNNQNSDVQRNLIKDESNAANPALDRAAIVQARTDAKVHADANGLIRPITLDKLIVTPTNEDLATRTVMSSGVVGTPNVDLNPLKGAVSNILVWERLETSGQGTDTSAYWFLADSNRVSDTLHSPMTQLPMMAPPAEVHDSLNWEYVIDAYYALGIGDPFGIWGSTGANG